MTLTEAIKAHAKRAAEIRAARAAGLPRPMTPSYGHGLDYRDHTDLTAHNAERARETLAAMQEVLETAFDQITALATHLSDAGDRFDPLNFAVALDDALSEETYAYRMALDEAADLGHHRAGRIDFKHDMAAE